MPSALLTRILRERWSQFYIDLDVRQSVWSGWRAPTWLQTVFILKKPLYSLLPNSSCSLSYEIRSHFEECDHSCMGTHTDASLGKFQGLCLSAGGQHHIFAVSTWNFFQNKQAQHYGGLYSFQINHWSFPFWLHVCNVHTYFWLKKTLKYCTFFWKIHSILNI